MAELEKRTFSNINKVFQQITVFFFRLYLTKYKITVKGKENFLDNVGSCVFVSNHLKYDDIPLISTSTELYLSFLAKKELFDNFFMGWWLRMAGTISVDREQLGKSTIREAKEALTYHKWRLGVFIEGTRSKNPGYLGRPNNGPVYLARLCKVPVVPIGISYRDDNEVLVQIGIPYEIDRSAKLEDESFKCLEKISELCDYKIPDDIREEFANNS